MSASTTSAFVSSRNTAWHFGQDHGTRGTDRNADMFVVEWDKRVRTQSEITTELGIKCSTRRPTSRQLATMANRLLTESGDMDLVVAETELALDDESSLILAENEVDLTDYTIDELDDINRTPGDWIPSLLDCDGGAHTRNTGQFTDSYEGVISEEKLTLRGILY